MLVSIDEAKKIIESNEKYIISGEEGLLKNLPVGNWIGGTIPYFMDINGGITTRERVFIDKINIGTEFKIKEYTETNINEIAKDAYENGVTFLIIPATSKVHLEYAQNSPNYKDIFLKPIIGWISGIHLDDLGKITPKIFNGSDNKYYDDKAIAMHIKLPENQVGMIGIVNIFEGGSTDVIKFEKDGFSAENCFINGEKKNFSDYLLKNKIDIKYPLVSDYFGTMVNVSFQKINEDLKTVDFYAPVFSDVEYKLAKPISDYINRFESKIKNLNVNPIFSCNCILNYLYSELENKKTGNMYGPMTFGEIAYQLLNQTLVYLEIKKI